MALKKGYKAMVDEAMAKVKTLSVAEAQALHGNPKYLFVDIRDPRELERDGKVTGAISAPRGMLEFWVDPDSPYYRKDFSTDREWVLYCGAGWRSALATQTLQEMGFTNVSHIDGGFGAWKAANAPIEALKPKT